MSDKYQTFKEINTIMPPESETRHNRVLWVFLILFVSISISLFLFFSTLNKTEQRLSGSNSNSNQKPKSTNLTDDAGNKEKTKQSEPAKILSSDTDALDSQQKVTTPDLSGDDSEHKIAKQIPDQPPVTEDLKITSFSKTLTFDFDSANLNADAVAVIQDIFNEISDKSGRLFIEGHITSDEHSLHQETGYDLTEMRVKNVANEFRNLGLGGNIRFSLIFGGIHYQVVPDEASEQEARQQVSITFKPD